MSFYNKTFTVVILRCSHFIDLFTVIEINTDPYNVDLYNILIHFKLNFSNLSNVDIKFEILVTTIIECWWQKALKPAIQHPSSNSECVGDNLKMVATILLSSI